MSFRLEYHVSVRHSISGFRRVAQPVCVPRVLRLKRHAQTNGPPASVISPGFGGRPSTVPLQASPPLGPRGSAPSSRGNFWRRNVPRDDGDGPHRHHYAQCTALRWFYAVPVPYAVDTGATDAENDADASADDNYQGGPTVFDRRGSGAEFLRSAREERSSTSLGLSLDDASIASASAASGPFSAANRSCFQGWPQARSRELRHLGQTLFDLTPGHARKIALADLDLDATRSKNEARGITFQTPSSSQAN